MTELSTYHTLLQRQLKKYFPDNTELPSDFQSFISHINSAYWEFDADREMLERSLDLSSRELLQANSDLRAVLQAIPDLFLWVNGSGLIVECRGGQEGDFFLPREKLIGKKLQDIPVQEVAEKFIGAVDRLGQYGPVVNIEYSMTINELLQYFEARFARLPASHLLVIIRNITERKKLEEDLGKKQKLESIGVLAGGIAHNFNNLLMSIMGSITIAKMKMAEDHPAADLLEYADDAAKQAKHLTRQFLTFARGGAPVRELVSVSDIVRSTVNFSLSGSNCRCNILIADGVADIEADSGQLSQTIQNLLINAAQSMPGGGAITLQVENERIPEPGRSTFGPGEYVKITVKDKGCGIPPEDLGKIYDPFFTTKSDGHGLGLATIYSIVKSHDGYIEVESTQNMGTEFCIYLPAASKTSRYRRKAHGTGRSRRLECVLVMDDKPRVRSTTVRMLKELGFGVQTANDGAEVVDLYQNARIAGENIFAVIVDLTVPGGMGGREAVQRILTIDPGARVVVSSGYSNDPVLAAYQDYGFCGRLRKPYSIAELNRVLREIA